MFTITQTAPPAAASRPLAIRGDPAEPTAIRMAAALRAQAVGDQPARNP